MGGKKSDEKQRFWEGVLNRQVRSGLSIRQFCAEEGVSQPSFYAWRRRRRASDDNAKAGKSVRRSRESSSGDDFIPLKVVDGAGAVEIVDPGGCLVRVSGEVNAQALLPVLEALDRRGAR